MNIFEKFGIKEVANVTFEALEDNAKVGEKKGDIVLFLDTLKVSTIETTADSVSAQGGWSNPKLVTWDYNKDVNLTLEDALISMESLRFMLGGKKIKEASGEEGGKVKIRLTEEVVLVSDSGEGTVKLPTVKNHIDDKDYATQPTKYKYINLDTGDRGEVDTGHPLSSTTCKAGEHLRIFWEQEVDGNTNGTAAEIVISPNSFPGVYRVYGDTFMRNADGKDQAMQFIIGKAKVLSNTTITMQAEGDPSTFEMTLNVMKSTNEAGESEMFKLVSYEL